MNPLEQALLEYVPEPEQDPEVRRLIAIEDARPSDPDDIAQSERIEEQFQKMLARGEGWKRIKDR